jgi:hypothetical protein
MRRISDYNEVTFHFLESMITHVAVTRPGLLVQIECLLTVFKIFAGQFIKQDSQQASEDGKQLC